VDVCLEKQREGVDMRILIVYFQTANTYFVIMIKMATMAFVLFNENRHTVKSEERH
jgi:hypothetical protein